MTETPLVERLRGLIERQPATVFWAPTARRRYFTRKAAADAEARALIRAKYPTERPDPDVSFGGWHWQQDDRLCRLHRRLATRIYLRALSQERRQ